MRIDIISAQPKLLTSSFEHSIIKRAQDKNIVEIALHDLRDYSINKHKQIDDTPFGGGAGMILMIEPIAKCIDQLLIERNYDALIYMTPDGETLKQKTSNSFSQFENILILCGHYKGIDQRVRDKYITHEISIGDYVLTGGELAAAVFVDSIVRLIPNVINDETSALSDSFQDNLLAPPIYTRPAEYEGMKVPDILISGHLKNIDQWRYDKSIESTKEKRPDIYKKYTEGE